MEESGEERQGHRRHPALRGVSLADSGRLDLVLIDVDLAVEIDGMAPTLRSILEPVGFTLTLDLMSGVIRADAARIGKGGTGDGAVAALFEPEPAGNAQPQFDDWLRN